MAIETGTGVTMTADKANVTQWLAWVLMILTGSMNRRGGIWFHPGFAYQLEAFELPISPSEGTFGPGPRSRPGTQSFMGEWPCAVLPDEIEAGNIHALLNLGGSLLTSFPEHRSPRARAAEARSACDDGDHRQRDRGGVDSRAADQRSARAPRPHYLGRVQFTRLCSTHTRRSRRRSATGDPCGGSWPSSAVDSATTSPTPAQSDDSSVGRCARRRSLHDRGSLCDGLGRCRT